jgi:hypothetical protein
MPYSRHENALNPAVGYNLKRARPSSQREKGVEPLALRERGWGEGIRRLRGIAVISERQLLLLG